MYRYAILTNSKRTLIAMAHSVVFLGVAIAGLFGSARPFHVGASAESWALVAIYFIVSGVLIWLTKISGGALERLYFACCAISASFGLLRQLIGDPPLHIAAYVRVGSLSLALGVSVLILWGYLAPQQQLNAD